jgi:MFS superfamily sulfate permease-like transporter
VRHGGPPDGRTPLCRKRALHEKQDPQPGRGQQNLRQVILQCSGIKDIDLITSESIETLNAWLQDMNVPLHLSNVNGQVTARLKRALFPN